MPTYGYRCENLHEFEALQRIVDDPLTECEVCGAPVQRMLYAPAVHFKGSGFYNTDYGKAKRGRDRDDSKSDGGGDGAKKDGGGDSGSSTETKKADTSSSSSGGESSSGTSSSGGESSSGSKSSEGSSKAA